MINFDVAKAFNISNLESRKRKSESRDHGNHGNLILET